MTHAPRPPTDPEGGAGQTQGGQQGEDDLPRAGPPELPPPRRAQRPEHPGQPLTPPAGKQPAAQKPVSNDKII